MSLRTTLPLAAVLSAAPLAAQQFLYDSLAHSPGNIWTDGIELVDIDNDGDVDVLYANGSGYGGGGFQPQQLFLNTGSGTFIAAHGQLNVANFNAKMVIAEDFDNDGDLDLMYAPEGPFPATTQLPRLLINDNSNPGNFTDESASRLPSLTMASFCVCAGDVDDDGDMDVVFTNGATFGGVATQARLYLNDGAGFFTDATASNMPVDTYNAQDVTLFDWDGDFDIDIALSGKGQSGKRSRLYLNDGTGNFTISSVLNNLGTGATYEIDWGDLDGDGDLDGMVQSISGQNEGVAYNNVASVTTLTLPFPNGNDDNEMAGLDYDDDGDLDVLVASLAGTGEKLYRNNSPTPSSFTNVNSVIQTISDSSLDIGCADLDNDGDIDIVTGQGESGNFTNKIYKNSGPADTQAPSILKVESPSYGVSSTVFHATTQDAIQDDGGDSFVTASYVAIQPSTSGDCFDKGKAVHQGGGTWRSEIDTVAGANGMRYCWTFTDREGNSSYSSQTLGTVNAWTDLGQGRAGTTGVPSLVGSGNPVVSGNITLDLTGALPNGNGAIVASPNADYAVIFGATFVPSIFNPVIFEYYTTDSLGNYSVSAPWPAGPSDCINLFFQAATFDTGAVGNFSYSNALVAIQL